MTEEIPTSQASRFEPMSVLWHLFAAPQVLLVLLGLLSLALALTTIIPQIPPQARDTPLAWLAVQPGILGQSGSLLHTLGLIDIFHAWWFRLLLVLTGLALFVRLVESSELAWLGTGRAPWKPVSFAHWGTHPSQVVLPSTLSAEDTLSQIRKSLETHGHVGREVPGTPNPNLVASHRPYALFARPVFSGALLLALAGLAVASYWGWQNQSWIPVPGESRSVGHGTPYKVRLDTLERPQGENAQLCEFASHVTWLEGENEIARAVASIGQPATLKGIAVRQIGLLPVATVRGQDNAGRPLSLQAKEELGATTEIKIEFPVPGDQHPVRITGHDLYLVLTFEQGGARDSSALLAALLPGKDVEAQLSDTEYQPLAFPHQGGTLSLDSLEFRAGLEFRPILRVDRYPGMPLVLGALVVALVALLVGWLARPHLVWIAVKPATETSATVRLLGLPGDRGNRYLPRLVTHLQESLSHDA